MADLPDSSPAVDGGIQEKVIGQGDLMPWTVALRIEAVSDAETVGRRSGMGTTRPHLLIAAALLPTTHRVC
jgi:hypothetical protein